MQARAEAHRVNNQAHAAVGLWQGSLGQGSAASASPPAAPSKTVHRAASARRPGALFTAPRHHVLSKRPPGPQL